MSHMPMLSRRPYDLPPTNRASRSLVKFVFGEEDEHEEALYGTANHRVSEGSRGR
ncbi:alkyl hydroperoxide reductase, partial [Burkholderia pseudomallei]|nr:alkyl hydroperoxide reductase [Burkholderia pseudomallei]MPT67680.1 alkyl hydroperoxide reductase [Burkholderia pseudomallei]MPT78619.1 alkyl hydroperoxide reductase [Burkholderia pseudomallei]MPT86433.1 alkyl hydroperoxide reductase [Burkholderia pseudomallei]MPT92534.1 alkyl hydroperoxide reductase [Burkholderia pseudomallei]